jgi:hypothetical protein
VLEAVRAHPQVVVGVLVHGPVVDQQPALVEEGTVADLAGPHPGDVVGVDALRRLDGVTAPELPLVER